MNLELKRQQIEERQRIEVLESVRRINWTIDKMLVDHFKEQKNKKAGDFSPKKEDRKQSEDSDEFLFMTENQKETYLACMLIL